MNKLYLLLKDSLQEFFKTNFDQLEFEDFLFQPTNKDHNGNLTLMVFPLAKSVKMNPDELARKIGEFLLTTDYISEFEVIKGFLNLNLSNTSWKILLDKESLSCLKVNDTQKIVLEYCGPNTNKPLHIGHLRNMFLGYSIAEILKAVGHQVHKVNIFNDRGIQICKSMIGYLEFANHSTPESEVLKGDFFVGKYYILFSNTCKEQSKPFIEKGLKKEDAEAQTEIFQKANALLLKWEEGDPEVLALWEKMNQWFYSGVRQTYERLSIDSEKDYYESKEYKKGKEIVELGFKNGAFHKDESGAIFIDLTDKGLDKKFLQRSNGTSLYITQDMSLIKTRFDDYHMDKMIYVVGDEQNYHFKVLKHIVEAMNEPFSKDIYHLSYGTVNGADGTKFKSREGTAADADLLIDNIVEEAKEQTLQSGKATQFSSLEIDDLSEKIGIGALRFSMLKVSATKSIIFDPKEAVDLNGDTGAFIQYCYVRTKAILNKYELEPKPIFSENIVPEEQNLILHLAGYHSALHRSADSLDPAEIALYTLGLAKIYNRFYTQLPILNAETSELIQFRVYLTKLSSERLLSCLNLLGISAPVRM